MKLAGKKSIILIGISILGGLIFSSYIIYEQKGQIGKLEIIPILISLLISIIIAILIIKRANR